MFANCKDRSEVFHIECINNPPRESRVYCSDCFQIWYCQRGRFTCCTKRQTALLTHGDIFIIPPDESFYIHIEMPYTVYYVLSFPMEFAEICGAGCRDALAFLKELLEGKYDEPRVTLPPQEIVFFECTISKIMSEYCDGKNGSREVIRNCLMSLLSILARIYPSHSSEFFERIYTKQKLIEYCISYVDAHCCEEITLGEITRLSAMSKAVFCELFKKETGLSFKDYLNRKRIQRALALLKSGEKITDIAYLCGYREFSTFYRNFIKFTGYSPHEYRQRQ